MIRNDFKISILFCWIAVLSCTPAGKISVSNVNDSGSRQDNSFIYALPQTILDIGVTAEEVVVIPGPYQKFAEKYLGIKHAPSNPEHHWNIRELRISSHIESDPDYVYVVRGLQDIARYPHLMQLIRDTLVIENSNFAVSKVYYSKIPPGTDNANFTDLSVKRNFEAEKDVEVSSVMPDTLYMRNRSGRTALKEKTLEQKAEEAANFLIKLKKRRFKLVAGQYDYMPEGSAMADALKELARIEEEYLSLFIGKRIVNTWHRNYHYTPVLGKETERIVLFRFSETEGFLGVRETGGIPVMLELASTMKTRGLERPTMSARDVDNLLYYRIADQAWVKLLIGEEMWAEALFPVFQFGVIVTTNISEK
jgi:hypothetical protein